MRKFSKSFLALVLVAVMAVSLIASATAAVVRDDSGNISYTPLEQGVYSNGGYTIDKVSHPTLGAGEVDAILSGKDQDRSNSYSWSMADGGEDSDYITSPWGPASTTARAKVHRTSIFHTVSGSGAEVETILHFMPLANFYKRVERTITNTQYAGRARDS